MKKKEKIDFGRKEERKLFRKNSHAFLKKLINLERALDLALKSVGPVKEWADIAILSLCTLCIDDFKQILLLSANGFGNGSISILRGMFERIVIAKYLDKHPESAQTFLEYHIVKLHRIGLDQLLKELDPDSHIIEKFKIERKPGGRKKLKSSWLEKDFIQICEEVGMDKHIKNAYHLPLEFAHPSVTAILSQLEEIDDKWVIKEDIPQRRNAHLSLTMAHYFLIDILSLILKHFNVDDKDPIYQQTLEDFKELYGKNKGDDNKAIYSRFHVDEGR